MNWKSNVKRRLRRSRNKSPICLICGYMILCVINDEIRSLNQLLVYIVSVSSFVKLGGQTSKDVHDIRMMCLEMTLCI